MARNRCHGVLRLPDAAVVAEPCGKPQPRRQSATPRGLSLSRRPKEQRCRASCPAVVTLAIRARSPARLHRPLAAGARSVGSTLRRSHAAGASPARRSVRPGRPAPRTHAARLPPSGSVRTGFTGPLFAITPPSLRYCHHPGRRKVFFTCRVHAKQTLADTRPTAPKTFQKSILRVVKTVCRTMGPCSLRRCRWCLRQGHTPLFWLLLGFVHPIMRQTAGVISLTHPPAAGRIPKSAGILGSAGKQPKSPCCCEGRSLRGPECVPRERTFGPWTRRLSEGSRRPVFFTTPPIFAS